MRRARALALAGWVGNAPSVESLRNLGGWPRIHRLVLVGALAIGLSGCSRGGGEPAPRGSAESLQGPGSVRPGTFREGSVRLGASESEFVVAFGSPVATFGSAQPADGASLRIDHFIRCAGNDRDELIVVLEADSTAFITRQICGALPSAQALQAEARHFFPTDSSPGGAPFTTAFGQSATRYVSRTLAEALPSSWFRDCNARAVAPGTFSVVLTARGWQL